MRAASLAIVSFLAQNVISPEELDQFVERVLDLRARRKAPVLPAEEAELLLQINQGLPLDAQVRYDRLKERRDAEALTGDEHRELLRLTEEVEELQLQRVKAMVELARLRRRTLRQLMGDLGIPAFDAA